jgi:8-oxo-dGTP pyrophosphatase MutT (NUDIX family)
MSGRTPVLRGQVVSDAVAALPPWLAHLADIVAGTRTENLTRFVPPAEGGRDSAVLVLFGPDDGEPPGDLLVIERAHTMRSHAGQPAFPGGAVEAGDDGAVAAALREADEEVGLVADGVTVFATLPDLYVPVSGFVVTPVLGWWHTPSPVYVKDPSEVASVHRVALAELIDPANRYRVRHPSGYVGNGFAVRDLLIWGFTAGIISGILDLAGWSVPWDRARIRHLEVP